MGFLDIVYLVLWGLLALFCIFSAHKLSPVMYILGGFFVFMFTWYLINDLNPKIDMFAGTYNLVFRGIALAFLVVLIIIYIYIKKHPKDSQE